jgi:TctA family transporter
MVTLVFNRNMGLIILVAAAMVGMVAMISYIRITLEKKKDL